MGQCRSIEIPQQIIHQRRGIDNFLNLKSVKPYTPGNIVFCLEAIELEQTLRAHASKLNEWETNHKRDNICKNKGRVLQSRAYRFCLGFPTENSVCKFVLRCGPIAFGEGMG